MADEKKYSYMVNWSDADQEYVATCLEFRSLSWLAASPESAMRGLRKVVADVLVDMEKSGEEIPEPLSMRRYSGKFMLRLDPEEHRRLALRAAEKGISLQRLAREKLAS
mgnify:FL=1